MYDSDDFQTLRAAIVDAIATGRYQLDTLREEIRPLRDAARRIQPRQATAVSLVAADGGNARVSFNPFQVEIVRVVDSSRNVNFSDVVTLETDLAAKSRAILRGDRPETRPLAELMGFLGVDHIADLSNMIQVDGRHRPVSPRWVEVYRELVEWATLFHILRRRDFATDTVVVFDGLLRSKAFAPGLFKKFRAGLAFAIGRHWEKRRRVFIVGVAKHSKVLTRYRLAMALEGVLATRYPAYVAVPREVEERAYRYADYARDEDSFGGGANRFVAGKLFLVKFGPQPLDPVWPVDIFLPLESKAPQIFGHLLADAANGFPVPYYPLCIQRAHENAALVDFDYFVLQDQIIDGVRAILGDQAVDLDVFRLQDSDPAQRRYESD